MYICGMHHGNGCQVNKQGTWLARSHYPWKLTLRFSEEHFVFGFSKESRIPGYVPFRSLVCYGVCYG